MTTSTLPFPKGARIALIGMGCSNRGVLSLLSHRTDLKLSLRDKKTFDIPATLPFLTPPRIIMGEGYLDGLEEDILFLSPTVKESLPEIQRAKDRGALITSDISFFLLHTVSECFAISGSDGKSTTSTLTSSLLRLHGEDVFFGGNIGRAASPALIGETPERKSVLEISSFQLMLPHMGTKRALITNLTPNHLDFHSSLEEYYNVKISLLFSTKEPVINTDDSEIVKRTLALMPYVCYTMKETLPDGMHPQHAYTVRGECVFVDGEEYFPFSALTHRGTLLEKNFLAALALTHGHHTRESALRLAREFVPLSHRCEVIRTLKGVRYYNSSVDSSPSRTYATLSGFSSPVVLILGGRSKGVGFHLLTSLIGQKARAVFLTGENAGEIREAIAPSGVPIYECGTLRECVQGARAVAQYGDAVLFSPASTSFDRYLNFEERGHDFSSLVNQLE